MTLQTKRQYPYKTMDDDSYSVPIKPKLSNHRNYTDEEIFIIRKHFNPLNSMSSCQMISSKYIPHRTPAAILGKASKMGLQRPIRLRKWTEEESMILKDNIEEPLAVIYKKLYDHWEKNDLPRMGIPTVKRRAILMGKGTKYESDAFMTKEYLAEGMGCSLQVITTWVHRYKEILKPQSPKDGASTIFISVSAFRRFAREYPGEIAKCRPDLLWLLSTLMPKSG